MRRIELFNEGNLTLVLSYILYCCTEEIGSEIKIYWGWVLALYLLGTIFFQLTLEYFRIKRKLKALKKSKDLKKVIATKPIEVPHKETMSFTRNNDLSMISQINKT